MRIPLVVTFAQKNMIMGTRTFCRCFLTGGCFLAFSLTGLANDNKPYPVTSAFGSMSIQPVADTIPSPQNKKVEDNTGSKPTEITKEVIKEVPKSRKQVKPLAVTTAVAVKPVVVKPKIVVKPIIKLH